MVKNNLILIGNCAGAMLRCTPKITSKALQNKVLYKYFLKGYSLLTKAKKRG
jgi:hypothetical protein